MKQILITIAAVVLVGCGDWQSTPSPETELPTDEPIAEVPSPPLPSEAEPC